MPAGFDAEVAELFRDLRLASNLSEADLAEQLSTRVEVVQALEQGTLYALPPWPETQRVVTAYGALLSLDVRPLLRRVYAQVEAGVIPATAADEFTPRAPQPQYGQPQPQYGQPERQLSSDMAPDRRGQPRPSGPGRNGAPPLQQPMQSNTAPPMGMPPGGVRPGGPPPLRPPGPGVSGQRGPVPQGQLRPNRTEEGAPQRRPAPPPPASPGGPSRPAQPPQDRPEWMQQPPRPETPAPEAAWQGDSYPAETEAVPEERKRGGVKKALWVIGIVLAAIVVLWLLFTQVGRLFGPVDQAPAEQEPGTEQAEPPAAPADPDDPQSRKSDRLPSPDPR